jgi:hypothetical protein
MLPPNEPEKGARRARVVRAVRRWVIGASTLLALTMAVGGFLHTKAGRPLLARMFPNACPMNFATAERVDQARRIAVAVDRGSSSAPARPAFGFRLDASTKSDVLAWAKAHHVSCTDEHAWLIKCDEVDPVALGRPASEGRVEELALGFRPDGRLVNVTTLRRHLTPEEGNRVAEQIGRELYRQLGKAREPDQVVGEGTLTGDALSSKRVSFRYADYAADVVALNLPQSGVAVREHYLSAAD